MPFTPFHLGPATLFGLLLFRFVNFPVFLVANVIVDLEPFLVLLLGLKYPLHGFFHSFLGGSIIAFIVALLAFKFRGTVERFSSFIGLRQKVSFTGVLLASFLGVYFHILLDAPLYTDIKPFYPLYTNPFYSSSFLIESGIYTFCSVCFLAGGILYVLKRVLKHIWKGHSTPSKSGGYELL